MTSPSKNNLIQLFTNDEYSDFYGLPHFSDEERSYFFALSLHDKDFIKSFRKNQDKVYCLLSLGYFRAKHHLIDFTLNDVASDRQYIINMYFSNQKIVKKLPPQAQRIRIQNKILAHENYTRLNKNNKDSIESTLEILIKRHPKARPLTKTLLQYLYEKRIALPGYSTLQRLITKALNKEHSYIVMISQKHIKPSEQAHINQLLLKEDSLYPITIINQDVKDFSYTELRDEIKRHDLLRPLFYIIKTIIKNTEFPKKTIDYYGSLVNFYSVYKLNRMSEQQSHWYLLCYSFQRYQKINDNLIEFFQHHVNNFHNEINEEVQDKLKQKQHSMHDSLIKAGQVLQLFTENNSKDVVEKREAFQILPSNHMAIVQQYLMGETRDEELIYWIMVDSIFHRITLYLRKLFMTIDFSLSQENEFGLVISRMQDILNHPRNIPVFDSCLVNFVPKKLIRYLVDTKQNILHWNRFEFFFYKTLSSAIKSKKIFLTHSLHYKPLEDELIFKDTWEKKKDTTLNNLGYIKLVTPIEQLLSDYRKELDPLIVSVNKRITTGDNSHVKIRKKADKIHWTLPYPKKPDIVNNPFFLQLPQINIVDILYFADQHSGFLNSFLPIQSHSIKDKRKDHLILAITLANAIRMGSYKMSINANLNLQELLTAEKTYFRLETLREAIDKINNATAQLPIFPLWNIHDKLHSSLDGSKIETRLNTLKARFSPKFFGLSKGISSLNLITNHLPINARTIGSNEYEGLFAFPLVYNNTSTIYPTQHSGDGHSINQFNLTLFDMINHRYMPHFPKIQKSAIYCFNNLETYDDCIIKPTRKLRENLILSEWPNIQHILASILLGETDQYTIIKILTSHDYHSKTKEALWEYDGILKSIHILNCIDDIKIRQAIRAALNRGEAYHQLCRAIACINGGKFRGTSELEMEIWNECTRLIASAIIFYNAFILSELLGKAKNDKQIEVITQVSPVAWAHLNFLGHYEFHRRQLSLEIDLWLKSIKIDFL